MPSDTLTSSKPDGNTPKRLGLGKCRECREDPGIFRNNRLWYNGNCVEEDGNRQAYL